MVNRARLVEEFLQLVKIDSPSGHEREIVSILKPKLQTLGCHVYEDDAGGQVGATAGNIIATLPGNGSGPILMLGAHMDTVEPGRGVKPIVKGDIISSSGDTVLGADDKAGIAVILETVRLIKENNISHGGLEIVFTIWEEGGLKGVKALNYSKIKSKMGYILDSDGEPGTIIVQAPAQNSIKATVKGKAAHAGQYPEEGINAIQVMAKAIAQMQLGRIDQETTANIGIIEGGKATNIVPDHTYIAGESRSLNPQKLKTITEEICNVLQQQAKDAGATVQIDVEELYPPINLSTDHPVVKLAVTAAGNLELTPVLGITGGGSDANIYNSRGIHCVNLGIGMSKAHTTDEYIKISDMCKATELVLEIIRVANQ